MDIKTYKKDFDYSYTLGAFPTFELVDAMPENIINVYSGSNFTDMERLVSKCNEKSVSISVNDKVINKLSDKGNVYTVGVFRKYEQELDRTKPHVVLVNPSDMGNLGTIIRTAAGFGILDIAIIEPAADIFNPKTIRASMGSIFRVRIKRFDSFDMYREYISGYNREIFTFMLNGEKPLTVADCPKPELYSLVFGNEASGLPNEYLQYGTSIIIPQSKLVDSLNLTIAAGIGMYMFTSGENVTKKT